MRFISHRGNLNGPSEFENRPEYIDNAINKMYDVEVDIWFSEHQFYLGHDKGQYAIPTKFLIDRYYYLWCHAKTPQALNELIAIGMHCFGNSDDPFVMTSRGYIWSWNCIEQTSRSVCVMPEKSRCMWDKSYGVCSDLVETFK